MDTKKTEVHPDNDCSSVIKRNEPFSNKKVKRLVINTSKSKKSILKDNTE